MPRSTAEKQVVDLKQQLRACQQAMSQMQANQEAVIQEAANIGYETGYLAAQERTVRCAEAIAEAVAKFEQTYSEKAPRVAVSVKAKRAGRKPARKSPARRRAKAQPAAEAPAQQPRANRPAAQKPRAPRVDMPQPSASAMEPAEAM